MVAAYQNSVPVLVTIQHSQRQIQAIAMTLEQRCSPSCSKTSCSAPRAVGTHVRVPHVRVPHGSESQHSDCAAADVQKDVTELDFSRVGCLLNGCEHGKSHSYDFLRIQVYLAGGKKNKFSSQQFTLFTHRL